MQIKQFMKTIEGLSDNTRKAYEQSLWLLSGDIQGEEPTEKEMQKFLNSYSPSSLYRHKAALKAYWEWRHPKEEPWPFNSRTFRAPREIALRYVKSDVVMKMVEKATKPEDRMFCLTLFYLGCRIHEIRLVDNESITDAGVVVKTKGGNVKLKLLTKDVVAELRKFAKGKKGKLFPMSYNYYYKLFKKLGKEVGHPEVSLHMYRHARALDLLEKKMSLAYVQQFLGHANINTTARYLQVTGGDLSTILEEVENGNKSKNSELTDTVNAINLLKNSFGDDPDMKKKMNAILSKLSKRLEPTGNDEPAS
jgi:integrase